MKVDDYNYITTIRVLRWYDGDKKVERLPETLKIFKEDFRQVTNSDKMVARLYGESWIEGVDWEYSTPIEIARYRCNV